MNTHKILKMVAGILAMLMMLGCLTACNTTNANPDGSVAEGADYTFTDALGQTITVNNPQRVVALMGSFAEIWTLAGGQDTLVGVTEDALDERGFELADSVTVVGTFQAPNIEKILALDPDLVLLSGETTGTSSHVALKDTFAAVGIPAAYFSVTHFPDYLDMLKICTDITGNKQAYIDNGQKVQERIDALIKARPEGASPTYLLCITYSGGIRPQTSTRMTGKMLNDLGCHNILDDHPGLLQDFSMEEIVMIDPDYVFVIPMGNDDAAAEKALKELIDDDPVWNGLRAVQEDHYVVLSKDVYLYKPNARWADAYAELEGFLDE